MSIVCNVCGRHAADRNLHCPEAACPFQHIPVYGSGQQIGDLRITQTRFVFRSAIYYEAIQNEEKVLVKIANQGCETQLVDESKRLAALEPIRIQDMRPGWLSRKTRWYKFSEHRQRLNDSFGFFLRLRPAYAGASVENVPYGTTTIHEQKVYYTVYEYVEGGLLRDWLSDAPVIWYPHAVYLMMMIAEAVIAMHEKMKVVHLNLSPNNILVRRDDDGYLRPILLDLGICNEYQNEAYRFGSDEINWLKKYGYAAYIPPEFPDYLEGNIEAPLSLPQADVYSVGALLYELLAGQPRFAHRELRDATVFERVAYDMFQPIVRQDIDKRELLLIAENATEHAPQDRIYTAYFEKDGKTYEQTIGLTNVQTIYDLLQRYQGAVPPEQIKRSFGERIQLGVVVAAFVLCIFLLVAVTLSPPPV